jgi:hypothetical protein
MRMTNTELLPCLDAAVKVLEDCGLSEIGSVSCCNILHMGSRRECSENRGEAIMSVLDATDWFKTSDSGDNLIKNLYRWEFVEEVRRKVGCIKFFNATLNPKSDECTTIFKKIADNTWTTEDIIVRGILLPFRRAAM